MRKRKRIVLSTLRKLGAADELERRRRAACWLVERRAIQFELEQLGQALELGLVDVWTGAAVGARGAAALGADVLLELRWQRAIGAIVACN